MADLHDGIEALQSALASAAHLVSPDELAPIEAVAEAAAKRNGFLGSTVVIALAGGTGSGKSSLLNALAGETVSPVGAVRPTTGEPVAWIPAQPEPGLVRLLDELGIERRVGHSQSLPVALVDLPDYDSIEFGHREAVERLIRRVDAIIWVLDPQKYADRSLHRRYLIPLVGYADQFLFVLNQVDRLDDAGRQAVLADLMRRLSEEGFADPPILTTAASPPGSDPSGIDHLLLEIESRFEAKRTAHAKLLEDLRWARRELSEALGQDGEVPAEVLESALESAVGGLADLLAGPAEIERATTVGERLATSRAAGPLGRVGALLRRSRLGAALGASPDEVQPGNWWAQPGLEGVIGDLSRTVTDVSIGLGSEQGRRLRADLSPPRLETEVRAVVEGARNQVGPLGPPAPRRWWSLVGAVQLALFALLVAGLVWLWVDGVDRGQTPWNLIVIGGSLIATLGLGAVTRASGRRAGRKRARAYRSDVETAVTAQLSTRVGEPVASAISARQRFEEELRQLDGVLEEVAAG